MFLTKTFKTNARVRNGLARTRQARFESLEFRRFCTVAVGLAPTSPLPVNPSGQMAGIQAIGTPSATDCLKLVSLNPQPEPPAPLLGIGR
jgi:hypothetical protein